MAKIQYDWVSNQKEDTLPHLFLLGDSIFDNARYVAKDLHVLAQLRHYLPQEWKTTLLAVDGSTTQDLHGQVKKIPSDATHLILSTGGNDAIKELPILQEPALTTLDAIERLSVLAEGFRLNYRRAMGWLLESRLPLALCTIYHPFFPDPQFQKIAETMLAIFNDVIINQAIHSGLPVLDLRRVCPEPQDFSNIIEPSEFGGKKIASAIAHLVHEHDFEKGRTEIFI